MKYYLMALAVLLCACDNQQAAMQESINKASNRRAYVQKNDIEFNNYDKRQRRADNPNEIVWCTAAFPGTNLPLFTVPVVGKLTSGGKRPFPTEPGPDGMYGSSGDYRYGFSPSGNMVDFYGIPTFCTDQPTIWQRESTKIVMASDPELMAAQKQASELLAQGKQAEAYAVLNAAIVKSAH